EESAQLKEDYAKSIDAIDRSSEGEQSKYDKKLQIQKDSQKTYSQREQEHFKNLEQIQKDYADWEEKWTEDYNQKALDSAEASN
ncbi:hypothetical protein ACJEI5_25100, partial [Escherichia coli]